MQHELLFVDLVLGSYYLSQAFGFWKFRRLLSYHTYAAKFSRWLAMLAAVSPPFMPPTILIPEEARLRATDYLLALGTGDARPGNYLAAALSGSDPSTLTEEEWRKVKMGFTVLIMADSAGLRRTGSGRRHPGLEKN